MDIALEIGILLILLVANGAFAMAEIAVVSARKVRLRQRAEAGDRRSRKALDLAESPNRFLSTVQIGITLVGIFAGAFGGARLSQRLAAILKNVDFLSTHADAIAFGVVVAGITYLSLVIGELVPKRVGLSNPERIAGLLAGPMQKLSTLARPLVYILSASTEGLLRLLGLKDQAPTTITEEEVKLLVREGMHAGVLFKTESEMVEGVLALDKLSMRDIMTPRAKIIWINQDDSHETIWHKIVVSGHTTFPVYQHERDRVVGIVSVKDIYAHMAAGIPVKLRDLVQQPLVVPVTQNALVLLETFKRSRKHVAVVIDEFGSVAGLASLHDIMEAIVGDFPSLDARLRPGAKRREDGSWLVDAMIPIDEFAATVTEFPLDPPATWDYETFGGFLVKKLGHLPVEGETIPISNYLVEIIDMDHHRIDKVLLLPAGRSPARQEPGGTE